MRRSSAVEKVIVRAALIVALFCAVAAPVSHAEPDEQSQPATHTWSDDLELTSWVAVGPLPNRVIDHTDTLPPRVGHDHDFFSPSGGESALNVSPGDVIECVKPDGTTMNVKAVALEARPGEQVSFIKLAPAGSDYLVAYAVTHIRCDAEQVTHARFGSDDNAKVWLNGELIHETRLIGRALIRGNDQFEMRLSPGLNRLVVKVENATEGWGFHFRLFSDAGLDRFTSAQELIDAHELLKEIAPEPLDGAYVFPPGELPRIDWRLPPNVHTVAGRLKTQVTWYDAALNEVEAAATPGRYLALAEATAPDGHVYRRVVHVYCSDAWWDHVADDPQVRAEFSTRYGIDQETWITAKDYSQPSLDSMTRRALSQTEAGASWLAWLHECADDDSNAWEDRYRLGPSVRRQAVNLRLKSMLDEHEPDLGALAPPRYDADAVAPSLRFGTSEHANIHPYTIARIDEVCEEWAEVGGAPFVVCLARNGIVFHHKGYGRINGRRTRTDDPMPIASVTKIITAALFAQFLDQGLVSLDDPVGRYLHELPEDGPHAITLRQCFTHTTGLTGHGSWGGLDNPFLAHVIADDPDMLRPGYEFNYNGDGYNLAGRVMEQIAGRCVLRLLYDQLFDPLEIEKVQIGDLAMSTTIRAIDLAKIGQLLVNRGAYGRTVFFDEDTMEQLLPTRLDRHYPDIANPLEWGVGIVWMNDGGAESVEGSSAPSRVLGHGSSTGTLFRADLDHNLVIIVARPERGEQYDHYVREVTRLIYEDIQHRRNVSVDPAEPLPGDAGS